MAEKEYTVVAPDGKEITLIGPVGASQEEIISQAQRLYNPQASANQTVEANQPSTAYDRFLNTLSNPQTGGRSGVVGPALVGGAGELVRGAGALTQMAFPEAGSRMVEVGEAMTKGAKSVNPVSATGGQIGSYLLPFSGAQKAMTAIGSVPAVQKMTSMIPSFARATGQQAAIGGALGYGLTPDEQNREQAALYGGAFGAATPTIGKAVDYVGDIIRGPQSLKGIQEAAKDVIQSGYTIPPTQVKPSLLNRVIEGVAGKTTTAQNASFVNQQVTNKLSAKALGLPEDTIISPELLKTIRTDAGQAYENLRLSGRVKTSPKFVQALDDIEPYRDAKAASADFASPEAKPIIDVIDSLKTPSFDVKSAVSKINLLRDNADEAFRQGKSLLGRANRDASEVLENTIENYLANSKQTELLNKFRQARQTIAKTYSVESALNPKTGTVDARQLANQLRGKKPLTGELKEIAEFGAAFPKAAQPVEGMGSLTQISPLDFFATAGLGAAGASTGSLENALMASSVGLIRPAFRSAALSQPIQQGLTKQQNLSPEARNLARMLMMQGAIKAGASKEE
jgi:hypothetical protein